jgi:hypothetical protein
LGRKKGPEWGFVVVVKEVPKGENGVPTVECCFCQHVHRAGAIRIRAHTDVVLGDMPALGVVICDKTDPHAIALLQGVENAAKEKATKKRKAAQMDRMESSKAGSSDQQSMLEASFEKGNLVCL